MSAISEEILATVAQKANIERGKLTPDAKLADLGISSLDTMELLFMLEEKFGLDISPGGATGNPETLQDIIALAEKEQTAKAAKA